MKSYPTPAASHSLAGGVALLLLGLFAQTSTLSAESPPDTANWWLQQVEEHLELIEPSQTRADILVRLAMLYAHLGDEDRVDELTKEAVTESEAAVDRRGGSMAIPFQSAMIEDILRMQVAARHIEELVGKEDFAAARHFIETAEEHLEIHGQLPEGPSMVKASLTLSLAAAGDIEGAWQLLHSLPQRIHREFAQNLLTMEGKGEDVTVADLRQRIEAHFPDWGINALHQPGRELAREGHWEMAQEIAEAIGSERSLSNIGRDMARQKAIDGDIAGAKALFDQITIPNDITNALLMIAGQAARKGDVETVRWIMEQTDEQWHRNWGWTSLVTAYVYAGEIEKAKQIKSEEVPDDEELHHRVKARYFDALVQTDRLAEAEDKLSDAEGVTLISRFMSIAEAHARADRDDAAKAFLARALEKADELKASGQNYNSRNLTRNLNKIFSLSLQVDDMTTVNRMTKDNSYFLPPKMSELWFEVDFTGLDQDQLAQRFKDIENPETRIMFALAIAQRLQWTESPISPMH
ncbi:MAG: hypothetical protein LAT55_12235 [Opitutales bacterium]|nr:hypothetical protein [Opitutales bacterium]